MTAAICARIARTWARTSSKRRTARTDVHPVPRSSKGRSILCPFVSYRPPGIVAALLVLAAGLRAHWVGRAALPVDPVRQLHEEAVVRPEREQIAEVAPE